jgi:uncharacterized protein (TIGR03437 family)
MSQLLWRNTLVVWALALPISILADVTGTPALAPNSTLNLDTGAVGISGGDLLWDGSNLTPQKPATAADLTQLGIGSGSTIYNTLIQATLAALTSILSSSPISSPAVNDIIVVQTHGGNFAKILVTAVNGTSLVLKFDTFTSSTPTGPNITAVTNNYSGIPAGLPSYGIAPGSLFVIYGSDLASASNTQEKFPLATNLNGTSVSVTVNGVTVQPGLYYVTPTVIGGVLPSSTPTGQGTITVTNGTQTSSAFTFQVVESAFGIDTVYGTGGGQAVVTDNYYQLIGFTASAAPGQVVIVWGSGVGADTKNDDKTYPAANLDNLTNIPMQAYIGGVSANIAYRGRSQYPGVDQVVITIPQNVPAGCNVSMVFVSGQVASNFTTLPVSANGGTCSDPNSPFNITSLSGDSTVSFGFVGIVQTVSASLDVAEVRSSTRLRTRRPFTAKRGPRTAAATTTTNGAFAAFESFQGAELGNYASYDTASIDSCIVYQESLSGGSTGPITPFTETGLDAGNITVSGPEGSAPLMEIAQEVGFYDASLSNTFIPAQGGSFAFSGSGGSGSNSVGSFNATVGLGSPLFSWTNMASITSVTRANGVTINWQGGEAGTYVEIDGFSEGDAVAAGFLCLAKQEDLQFTVPSWVTDTLPVGQGSLDVSNVSNPVQFTAKGLNFAYAYAEVDNSTDQIPYN